MGPKFIPDKFLEFSDEEVLSASPSVDNSEDTDEVYSNEPTSHQTRVKPIDSTNNVPISDSDASEAPSDEDDLGGWGTSKQDYYNADVIETEADALEEEAEARRLQQKSLQGMTEADFGFDEAEWLDAGKEDEAGYDGGPRHGVVSEVLPQQEITDATSADERLSILRTRYPEFEPLAQEFVDLQSLHGDLALAAATALEIQKRVHNDGSDVQDKLPIAAVKHRALSAYLAALCMYFALLTSSATASEGKTTAMSPTELRDHPIMDTLVKCRDFWNRAKDLVIPEPVSMDVIPSEALDKATNGATVTNGDDMVTSKPKLKKRKSKAERAAALAQDEAQARRLERLRETEASLASLSSLTKADFKPKKPAQRPPPDHNDADSDFGDPTHLAPHEAAQKAERKKSLKFYTSQIASKLQKRGAAGRDAGGDADIPYKERLRDRQDRLNAQAEKRGKNSKPTKEEALGGDSDEEDAVAAQEIRDEDNGGEDYYQLIRSKASAKKAAKAKVASAHAAVANGLTRVPDEALDDESKRAISYAIEKNKGLHPKRKKEVRNPRVQKRKKFEEKKKKLGSIRPVYKGGEGKGYQGELTGIKGGLVRSVKL